MTTAIVEQPAETVIEEKPLTEAEADAIKAESFKGGFKEETTGTPSADEPTPEPTTSEAPVVPAVAETVPEHVQLTKAEYDDLLKLKGMAGKLDEGFGRLGNLQQLVKELQTATTAGEPIVATEEDLKELMNEDEGFPLVAKSLLPALNRLLSKMRVKGTASAAPASTTAPAPIDREALLTEAETRVEAKRIKVVQQEAREDLNVLHPDWYETVWGDKGNDPNVQFGDLKTPFKQWVDKQADNIRLRLLNSNNSEFLSNQLTRFKKETASPATPPATPAPKPNERTARLAASVTPRGVAPGSTPPEDNSVSAGFKAEMKAMGQPVS